MNVLAQVTDGWTTYLPPTLQISTVYWVMGAAFAARMMAGTIPDNYRTPWLLQLLTLVVGVAIALCAFPASVARVYAVATGMMSSAFAVQFYDMAFSYLEKKLRIIFGLSSPAIQEPVTYDPTLKKP